VLQKEKVSEEMTWCGCYMIEPSMFGGLAKTAEPMEMPYGCGLYWAQVTMY